MWEVVQEGEEMSMPIPVMEGIINVFCPALMSAMEFEGYLASIIEAAGNSSFVGALVAELVCLGYIVITYLLEKIHAYWHEEEGVFAMCVDMLCIENIVFYIFNLLLYVISIIFKSLNLPNVFLGILIVLFALPTFWGFLFQVAYAYSSTDSSFGLCSIVESGRKDNCILDYGNTYAGLLSGYMETLF